MATKPARRPSHEDAQEVCIDLPGEAVQCWRSGDKVRVILRKHRDVIFDINLGSGRQYSVESKSSFYSPRDKKLVRKVAFTDGEVLNLWVGREFKGDLELKSNGRVLGTYRVNDLDGNSYGPNPKTKPEPLMVIMGQRDATGGLKCGRDDPLGVGWAQVTFKPHIDPKLGMMPAFGSQFSYQFVLETTEVVEYVAVTEAVTDEIQAQVVRQLEQGEAVVGRVDQIFVRPPAGSEVSPLYRALAAAAGYISRNEVLTNNLFKEAVGYVQENFHELNKLGMTVRIERKAKGKYRVALKGRTVTEKLAQIAGKAVSAKPSHVRAPMGTETTRFIDGGFAKSGRGGYGGFKRIVLTSAENFKGGLKIQAIGTVIDLICDADAVFFDEKGSGDVSEFLGRAGVSVLKAGATAAIGAVISTGILAVVATVGAAPVILVALVVVGGYAVAAYAVDKLDDKFQIKENVANFAR